jgi:hypothetical protein
MTLILPRGNCADTELNVRHSFAIPLMYPPQPRSVDPLRARISLTSLTCCGLGSPNGDLVNWRRATIQAHDPVLSNRKVHS